MYELFVKLLKEQQGVKGASPLGLIAQPSGCEIEKMRSIFESSKNPSGSRRPTVFSCIGSDDPSTSHARGWRGSKNVDNEKGGTLFDFPMDHSDSPYGDRPKGGREERLSVLRGERGSPSQIHRELHRENSTRLKPLTAALKGGDRRRCRTSPGTRTGRRAH